MTVVETRQVPAYRTFPVRVSRVHRLSPGFLRITFTGTELAECAPNGWDQRIKVVLPVPGRGMADCPDGADWYGQWRALPEDRRPPIRTYTVRAWRPELREIDVDFVLHGPTGPASAWAERAAVGDEIALVGPNARFPGPAGGFEWRPPADAACLLIAGDETAVPAICAIVESLQAGRRPREQLEEPTPGDIEPLAHPADVEVTWLARDAGEGSAPAVHGRLLTAAVVAAVHELGDSIRPAPAAAALHDIDVDAEILWEVPPDDAPPAGASGVYAWLAGEAGVVKGLRRHLVQDVGLHRTSVAFMGYWREGRAQ